MDIPPTVEIARTVPPGQLHQVSPQALQQFLAWAAEEIPGARHLRVLLQGIDLKVRAVDCVGDSFEQLAGIVEAVKATFPEAGLVEQLTDLGVQVTSIGRTPRIVCPSDSLIGKTYSFFQTVLEFHNGGLREFRGVVASETLRQSPLARLKIYSPSFEKVFNRFDGSPFLKFRAPGRMVELIEEYLEALQTGRLIDGREEAAAIDLESSRLEELMGALRVWGDHHEALRLEISLKRLENDEGLHILHSIITNEDGSFVALPAEEVVQLVERNIRSWLGLLHSNPDSRGRTAWNLFVEDMINHVIINGHPRQVIFSKIFQASGVKEAVRRIGIPTLSFATDTLNTADGEINMRSAYFEASEALKSRDLCIMGKRVCKDFQYSVACLAQVNDLIENFGMRVELLPVVCLELVTCYKAFCFEMFARSFKTKSHFADQPFNYERHSASSIPFTMSAGSVGHLHSRYPQRRFGLGNAMTVDVFLRIYWELGLTSMLTKTNQPIPTHLFALAYLLRKHSHLDPREVLECLAACFHSLLTVEDAFSAVLNYDPFLPKAGFGGRACIFYRLVLITTTFLPCRLEPAWRMCTSG